MSDEIEDTVPESSEEPSVEDSVREAFDSIEESGDSDSSASKPQPSKVESAEEVEAIPAPISYRAETKEFWQTLPRKLQEEIYKRETERERVFSQRSQEAANLKRRYEQIDQIFAPYRDELLAKGLNESQLIGQYMMFDKHFATNPVETINALLASRGLTYADLTADKEQIDPTIQDLQQQVAQLNGYLNQQNEVTAHQHRQAVVNEVANFGEATDQNGQRIFPYFEQVSESMLPIVREFRARNPRASNQEILQAAYDMAVYADPRTRPAMLDAYARELQTKQLQDARKQAQKAKRASSPLRGSPSGQLTGESAHDLRETLLNAWDSHLGA